MHDSSSRKNSESTFVTVLTYCLPEKIPSDIFTKKSHNSLKPLVGARGLEPRTR